MKKRHKNLLILDGLIDIILGLFLLLFPFGVADFLGLPRPASNFYPSILGAVIFGIGLSLLIERFWKRKNIHGLGLAGALVINFCGSLVLIYWLITRSLAISLQGYITLWIVALVVFGCGMIEIFKKSWKYK